MLCYTSNCTIQQRVCEGSFMFNPFMVNGVMVTRAKLIIFFITHVRMHHTSWNHWLIGGWGSPGTAEAEGEGYTDELSKLEYDTV